MLDLGLNPEVGPTRAQLVPRAELKEESWNDLECEGSRGDRGDSRRGTLVNYPNAESVHGVEYYIQSNHSKWERPEYAKNPRYQNNNQTIIRKEAEES